MYVDARATVSPFRHQPRQIGNSQIKQFMSESINADGLDSRVAKYDFIASLRSRVVLKSRFHVGLKQSLNGRKTLKKMFGEYLRVCGRTARLLFPAHAGRPSDSAELPWQSQLSKSTERHAVAQAYHPGRSEAAAAGE
jgi:hypothetical protein